MDAGVTKNGKAESREEKGWACEGERVCNPEEGKVKEEKGGGRWIR
jgi:hypothetical protein